MVQKTEIVDGYFHLSVSGNSELNISPTLIKLFIGMYEQVHKEVAAIKKSDPDFNNAFSTQNMYVIPYNDWTREQVQGMYK